VRSGKGCNTRKTYNEIFDLKNVLAKSTSKNEHRESDTLLPSYYPPTLGTWNSGARFTLLCDRLLCQHSESSHSHHRKARESETIKDQDK